MYLYRVGGATLNPTTLVSGWSAGEPGSDTDHEYCGSLIRNDGFKPTPCHQLLPVVCEIPGG